MLLSLWYVIELHHSKSVTHVTWINQVQNQEKPPRGLYVTQVMKEIVAKDGVAGLYRGVAPAVVRR